MDLARAPRRTARKKGSGYENGYRPKLTFMTASSWENIIILFPRCAIGKLTFFMKCNQNCQKAAGNPKQQRRFLITFSTDAYGSTSMGYSNSIFIHNNSKHSRTRKVKSPPADDILVKLEGTVKIYIVLAIKVAEKYFFKPDWWS